jgi:glycosyltransferase involved in cell wall biosynthesis
VHLGIKLPKRLVGAEPRPKCPFILLSVGRLEPNKRVEWILEALSVLEQRIVPLSREVDWHLEIVGDGGEMNNLKARCQQLGLGNRVVFHGFVPDEQLDGVYERANLLVMPAIQGFGIPVMEALAKEIPVVLNRDSRVSELLAGSRWVEIVDDGPGGLAEGIRKMSCICARENFDLGPPPCIKSDAQWFEEIADLCGWRHEADSL